MAQYKFTVNNTKIYVIKDLLAKEKEKHKFTVFQNELGLFKTVFTIDGEFEAIRDVQLAIEAVK